MRAGAARLALGLFVAAWPSTAIAGDPPAAELRPLPVETAPTSSAGALVADAAPARAMDRTAPPELEALESWSFVAGDPSTGAAVVGRAGEGLRVVRSGDRIESFEVAGLLTDRVVLRPVPGAPGLEEIREVWLLRGRRAGEPRIRILGLRDDATRPARLSPTSTEGTSVPEGAKTVTAASRERAPR